MESKFKVEVQEYGVTRERYNGTIIEDGAEAERTGKTETRTENRKAI